MFFNDWYSLGRILVMGLSVYVSLIVIMRATGNRTLSAMNTFDFIITVAFGTMLSSTILTPTLSYSEGMLGLAFLVLLQYTVTFTAARSRRVNRLLKTPPTLLFYQGAYMKDAMRRVRVTEDEVRNAIRSEGFGGLDDIAAVVLETDGQFSVMSKQDFGSGSALEGVHHGPGSLRITTAPPEGARQER